MADVYNYSKARQNLAAVLDQAAREGEVRIKRRDGQVFVIKPEDGTGSALDIEGVNLNISTDEVVAILHSIGASVRSDYSRRPPWLACPLHVATLSRPLTIRHLASMVL